MTKILEHVNLPVVKNIQIDFWRQKSRTGAELNQSASWSSCHTRHPPPLTHPLPFPSYCQPASLVVLLEEGQDEVYFVLVGLFRLFFTQEVILPNLLD